MSPRRRRIVRIALTLLLLYALVMTFGGCADRLILHPPQGRIDAGRACAIMIKSQGRDVEVWTARSPAAATTTTTNGEVEAYVLEFCGNATRAEQITQFVADRWHRFPVEVWVMNYPGYGGSAVDRGCATSRRRRWRPTTRCAARRRQADLPLRQQPGHDAGAPRRRESPGGRSRSFKTRRRCAAFLLSNYGWWNLWLAAGPVALQVPAELNSTATAPRVNAPAVFISASGDEVVPPAYHRIVFDAYAGEKRLINLSGAMHGSSIKAEGERQLQDGIDWMWQRSVSPMPEKQR